MTCWLAMASKTSSGHGSGEAKSTSNGEFAKSTLVQPGTRRWPHPKCSLLVEGKPLRPRCSRHRARIRNQSIFNPERVLRDKILPRSFFISPFSELEVDELGAVRGRKQEEHEQSDAHKATPDVIARQGELSGQAPGAKGNQVNGKESHHQG